MSASDGASVPRILQLLDWELRAMCQDVALRPIFDKHDLRYARGGSEDDRLDADVALYLALKYSQLVSRPQCRTVFEGVRLGGGAHWTYPPVAHEAGVQAP